MKRWTLIATCLFLGAVIGTFATQSYLQGQADGEPPAPVIPAERTSYRALVKQVLPAVVSLHGKGVVTTRDPRSQAESNKPITGFGSGFILDPQGVVLTNYHVVEGLTEIEVRLQDGRKFTSKDIRKDPKTDIALVRFMVAEPLPSLALGDSDSMEIGDRVLAFGAPFGLSGSVSSGIISGKGRSLDVNLYEDFLQTDAAVNPGNSGGPLVNMQGQVIGITSAIKSKSGGFQGVGLAIASNLIRDVAKQLRETGTVKRGYLGAKVKPITDEALAARLGVKAGQGLLLTHVYDNSPSSKAGLKAGDILLLFANRPVSTVRRLQQVIARVPVGQPTELVLVRDGKTLRTNVTLEEQPKEYGRTLPSAKPPTPAPRRTVLDSIGIGIDNLDAATARRLGVAQNAGVLIVEVLRNGTADQGGLRPGMLILQVDRQDVTSAKQCSDVIERGSLKTGILVKVWSKSAGASYVLIKSAS